MITRDGCVTRVVEARYSQLLEVVSELSHVLRSLCLGLAYKRRAGLPADPGADMIICYRSLGKWIWLSSCKAIEVSSEDAHEE
jgi:hypothetical protein